MFTEAVRKFLLSLRNRIIRSLLLYLSLFLSLEYFWWIRLGQKPTLYSAEYWKLIVNLNVRQLGTVLLGFGAVLICLIVSALPLTVVLLVQDLLDRRYGSFISTCISIPSFLTLFFSSSAFAAGRARAIKTAKTGLKKVRALIESTGRTEHFGTAWDQELYGLTVLARKKIR